MITEHEYKKLRQKYDDYHEAANKYRKPNGWLIIDQELRDKLSPCPTNDEISAMEVYEFVNNPPRKYFAYVDEETGNMITWTGEFLGTIAFGRPYRSNFGDWRTPISIDAINGKYYYGIYYASSGNYCRIRQYKSNNPEE